jgi:E3 ubiquitin-protein ligase RNF144
MHRYCYICLDDDPIDEIFSVRGCNHTYCRKMIRAYITDQIKRKNIWPRCPYRGCSFKISEGEIKTLLTLEEQENYERVSREVLLATDPTMHACLQPNCRGFGAIPLAEPRFVCPSCHMERCVKCNTREWHAGLTCLQAKQRGLDGELHAEQLCTIYGEAKVYQCGQCEFGPVEHIECEDLTRHQNERVGHARINNACPRCGWFAGHISQWPRWNGKLP